ncbi:hypothetical protein M3Y99_00052800 [Aphelenchoides fujianensis]|nr:hypothetical protein M3Y99_00052800 [Aphelenchoides fujianensis]
MSPLRSVLVFLAIVAVALGGECPPGSIPGFPNYPDTAPCYLFERFPTQFVTAERMCRDSHGHLSSIPDGFVNAFVAHGGNEAFLVMEVEDFWIGGQNLEDQSVWRWADDTRPFLVHELGQK